jgi:hypothetical protein
MSESLESLPINNELWMVLAVAVCLLGASIWLMRSHIVAWRAFQSHPGEIDFRRRQFHRRMWTSALLGLLALSLGGGHILVFVVHSDWFELAYWAVNMLLAACLGILAMLDFMATKRHLAD